MTLTQARPAIVRTRRAGRRLVLVVTLLVAVAAVVGYLVWFSDLTVVDRVEVIGADQGSVESVEAAAAVAVGSRMISVDPAAVAERVGTVDAVATAEVQRRWPGTVRITVTERTPAAVLAVGRREFRLFDSAGVEYARAATAPADLPLLRLDREGATEAVIADMLAVHSALPAELRAQVKVLAPVGPDDLRFTLKDGAEIRWGSVAEGAAKAESLRLLRAAEPGRDYYDVAAPEAPAVG